MPDNGLRPIGVRLPAPLHERLLATASARIVSPSVIMARALERFLDDLDRQGDPLAIDTAPPPAPQP